MRIHAEVAEQYADFAAYAESDSPCFSDWARRVTEDEAVLAWLDDLPVTKRQPNLVFAAARWHGCPAPAPYDVLRATLLGDDGSIVRTVRERSTQTNEVGRLATLLPALGLVAAEEAGPLALVEVGASAGLCLYPDRFGYRWLTDDGATAWLTTLVWPEQDDRRQRLAAAVAVARAEPPTLLRGDLLEELPPLVDLAARHGRVVVFHSAVAAYLDEGERARFVEMMTGLVDGGVCRWVSNEGKDVLPTVTATGPAVDHPLATFVLGLDGRALAWTHGHGRSLTWH